MSDNATFIQFPPLGSSTSLITVFGDNRVNIQRTIRSIMQLVSLHCTSHSVLTMFQACTYYVGSFWLLPIQFNALLPPATLAASQVSTLLKQISLTTGAEVVFKSMCFEMHGLEHEVRAAVNMVMDLDIIKVCPRSREFDLRLIRFFRRFSTKFGSRLSFPTNIANSSVARKMVKSTRLCRRPTSRSNSRRSTTITS